MRNALVLLAAAMMAGFSGCNMILGNDAAALDTGDAPPPEAPAPAEPVGPGAPVGPTDPASPAPSVTLAAPIAPVAPPEHVDAGVVPVTPDAESPCPAERKLCFGVCVPAAQPCTIQCEAHRADCNVDPDDGCEAKLLEDKANCGGCGVVCAPGTSCKGGTCKKVGPT